MSKNSEKSTKIGKGGKILLALCIIIIISLGIIIYLLLNKTDANEKRNIVVNEKNAETTVSEMADNEKIAPGYYELTMNFTWDFDNGTAISENAYIKNAETNDNAVYVDVTLSDTNEIIYASPIIPVGSYLDNISLDSDLNAGTYDCVATYHLLDEANNSISTVRVNLSIVIVD